MIVNYNEIGKKLEEKLTIDKKSNPYKASIELEIPHSSLQDILKDRAAPKMTGYFVKLVNYLNIPFITIVFDKRAFHYISENSKQWGSIPVYREEFLPIFQEQFDKLVADNEAAKNRLGK